MSKNYISGFEETVSRFLSLVATLAFFSIYILSKEPQKVILDWSNLMIHLAIFWLVYEFVGYILFIILVQFSSNRKPAEVKETLMDMTIKNPEIK